MVRIIMYSTQRAIALLALRWLAISLSGSQNQAAKSVKPASAKDS